MISQNILRRNRSFAFPDCIQLHRFFNTINRFTGIVVYIACCCCTPTHKFLPRGCFKCTLFYSYFCTLRISLGPHYATTTICIVCQHYTCVFPLCIQSNTFYIAYSDRSFISITRSFAIRLCIPSYECIAIDTFELIFIQCSFHAIFNSLVIHFAADEQTGCIGIKFDLNINGFPLCYQSHTGFHRINCILIVIICIFQLCCTQDLPIYKFMTFIFIQIGSDCIFPAFIHLYKRHLSIVFLGICFTRVEIDIYFFSGIFLSGYINRKARYGYRGSTFYNCYQVSVTYRTPFFCIIIILKSQFSDICLIFICKMFTRNKQVCTLQCDLYCLSFHFANDKPCFRIFSCFSQGRINCITVFISMLITDNFQSNVTQLFHCRRIQLPMCIQSLVFIHFCVKVECCIRILLEPAYKCIICSCRSNGFICCAALFEFLRIRSTSCTAIVQVKVYSNHYLCRCFYRSFFICTIQFSCICYYCSTSVTCFNIVCYKCLCEVHHCTMTICQCTTLCIAANIHRTVIHYVII